MHWLGKVGYLAFFGQRKEVAVGRLRSLPRKLCFSVPFLFAATVVRDVTSITAEKGASGAVTTILASTNSAFSPVAPTAAERSSSVRMYPELPAVAKVYPVVETRVVRTRRQSTSSDGDEFPDTDVRSLASSARSTETVVRGTSEDHGEAASPRSEQSGGFVTPPSSDEKAEHAGGDTKVSNVPSYKVLYKVSIDKFG